MSTTQGAHARPEAAIVINGHRLTEGQSCTVRVALHRFADSIGETVDWESVARELASDGLVDEASIDARLDAAIDRHRITHEPGSTMLLYADRIEELLAMIVLVAGSSGTPRARALMRALEHWVGSRLDDGSAIGRAVADKNREHLVAELAVLTGEGVFVPCV